VDLVESRARKVWLSVRTAPNILRRQLAGLPTQAISVLIRKLPVAAVDRIAGAAQRLTVGDLSKYGMPAPERGVYTRLLSEERIPILDVGLIRALKRREVTVVPAVESIEGAEVVLHGGRRLRPDAVISATGFRRGLENLVGHLGVLDEKGTPVVHGDVTHPRAPNLYFIGYSNPISGNLRELGIDARRIARALGGGGQSVPVIDSKLPRQAPDSYGGEEGLIGVRSQCPSNGKGIQDACAASGTPGLRLRRLEEGIRQRPHWSDEVRRGALSDPSGRR
jgi:putative flavoprotein involved in K+ transport